LLTKNQNFVPSVSYIHHKNDVALNTVCECGIVNWKYF